MKGSLLKSGAIYFAGILLGRIFGLVREILIGVQFGKSHLSDTAILMIRVPDTLLAILVGGAMSAALIPEIKSLSKEDAWRLYSDMIRWVGIVVVPLWVVLAIWPQPLLRAFGPAVPDESIRGAASAMPIMLLTIPFACLSSVATAFLQAENDFTTSSLTTFVYNVGLVFGITLMHSQAQWSVLASAAAAGSLISWGMQWLNLRRHRAGIQPNSQKVVSPELLKRYGQAVLAGGVLFLMPSLAGRLASSHGDGAITLLNYAIKLTELPLGTLLTVFAVVLFPVVSGKMADASLREEGLSVARNGVGVVLVLAIPIAATMILLAEPFCKLLFGYGAMAANAGQITPFAQLIAGGLVAQALIPFVQGVLNALKDTLAPFWATVGVVAAFWGIGWLAGNAFGLTGVAAAYAITQWLLLSALLIALKVRHKVGILGDLIRRDNLRSLGIALIISVTGSLAAAKIFHSPFVLVVAALIVMGLGAGLGLLSNPKYAEYGRRLRSRFAP